MCANIRYTMLGVYGWCSPIPAPTVMNACVGSCMSVSKLTQQANHAHAKHPCGPGQPCAQCTGIHGRAQTLVSIPASFCVPVPRKQPVLVTQKSPDLHATLKKNKISKEPKSARNTIMQAHRFLMAMHCAHQGTVTNDQWCPHARMLMQAWAARVVGHLTGPLASELGPQVRLLPGVA